MNKKLYKYIQRQPAQPNKPQTSQISHQTSNKTPFLENKPEEEEPKDEDSHEDKEHRPYQSPVDNLHTAGISECEGEGQTV